MKIPFKSIGFFIGLLLLGLILTPFQPVLAWFGFFVAAYSTMANDSILTLGTFLSSHRKTSWWLLWAIFGSIMVAVVIWGWVSHNHTLGFGRLEQIPEPQSIRFIEVLAPIVLLGLTQLRTPVSTTFLILSIFSSDLLINQMLLKSFLGYVIAFVVALCLWGAARILLSKPARSGSFNEYGGVPT